MFFLPPGARGIFSSRKGKKKHIGRPTFRTAARKERAKRRRRRVASAFNDLTGCKTRLGTRAAAGEEEALAKKPAASRIRLRSKLSRISRDRRPYGPRAKSRVNNARRGMVHLLFSFLSLSRGHIRVYTGDATRAAAELARAVKFVA